MSVSIALARLDSAVDPRHPKCRLHGDNVTVNVVDLCELMYAFRQRDAECRLMYPPHVAEMKNMHAELVAASERMNRMLAIVGTPVPPRVDPRPYGL